MSCSDQKNGIEISDKPVSHRLKVTTTPCGCRAAVGDEIPTSKHYITGSIQTPAGNIPQVSTRLDKKDYLGAFKVRWGIRRDFYRVDPGLYAVGNPNERSDVLVTANFKLTFDIVRKNLSGLHVWLLVLDTTGVNVWCSAGKGNFGTKELVSRIQSTSLEKVVTHRRIILPQLGATGVAAHLVKESSGFTVMYGPVRASDIKSFILAGYKATKEMRRVHFDLYDRLKLIPNDLIYNLRYFGMVYALFFILSGINADGFSLRQALSNLLPIGQIIAAGYAAGIILTPALLPFIPVRNFAFKGFLAGAAVSLFFLLTRSFGITLLAQIGGFFLVSGLSSFLAMNFTGASTFTSLAGVKKEMKIAVPIQIASAVVAVVLVILNSILYGR